MSIGVLNSIGVIMLCIMVIVLARNIYRLTCTVKVLSSEVLKMKKGGFFYDNK